MECALTMPSPSKNRQKQAYLARCVPSDSFPLHFEIYRQNEAYPSFLIAHPNQAKCMVYDTIHKAHPYYTVPDKDMVTWVESQFPQWADNFKEWLDKQPIALHETPEEVLCPNPVIQGDEMIIELMGYELYARMEKDRYHFVFGGRRSGLNPTDEYVPKCEYSLRHIYLIDKAMEGFFKHLRIPKWHQARFTRAVETLKDWLDKQHERPPAPRRAEDAGASAPMSPLKLPMQSFRTLSGKVVEGFINRQTLRKWVREPLKHPYTQHGPFDTNEPFTWFLDETGERYVIPTGDHRKSRLGRGGFSVVRPAQNLRTGEWFAAKIQETERMPDEKIDIEEYLLGLSGIFHSTARLSDSHLRITLLKWLPGKTLTKTVRPRPNKAFPKMTENERTAKKARLILSVFEQLQRFHDSGYLHRDIKMDNIIMDVAEESAYLLDFGAAERTDYPDRLEIVCYEAHPVTTHNYNAPELAKPKAEGGTKYVYNEATEVFALGRALGELVSDIEGFDICNYQKDIMGFPPYPPRLQRFTDFTNYWLDEFNTLKEVQLSIEDFTDENGQLLNPYNSAMNHTGIRTVIDTVNANSLEDSPRMALYQLFTEWVAERPEDRPTVRATCERLHQIIRRCR